MSAGVAAADQAQSLRERLRLRLRRGRAAASADPLRLRLLASEVGVGRTAVGSLLAQALVARGRDVLVVDGRPHAPLVRAVGGTGSSGVRGLPGWVRIGAAGRRRVAHRWRGQTCDTVILLGPAGVGHSLRFGRRDADALLIVAAPDHGSLSGAYSIFKRLVCDEETASSRGPYLVLNRAPSRSEVVRVARRIDAVARRFVGRSFPLVAALLDDASLRRAASGGWSPFCETPGSAVGRLPEAAHAVEGLAAEVDRACRERELGRAREAIASRVGARATRTEEVGR